MKLTTPSRLLPIVLLTIVAFTSKAWCQEAWTRSASPTIQNLWSVAYGDGHFVAVGEGSSVISSPDGTSWVQRTVPVQGYWLVAVANGAGTWVLVGDNGLILTSTNLTAWSKRESGTTSRINGIAYGGGRWIAVADSGELLTSTDSIAWTKLKPSGDRLHGIVYAYGQFVITGDNGLIRATVDATDYAERMLPGGFFVEAVTYAKRSFLAVGESGFVVKSTDGFSWDSVNSGTSSHFRGIAFFNNQFIAAGTDGTIITTPDTTTPWMQRSSGTNALLTSVAASDACAIAVGFGGTILRSLPAAVVPTVNLTPSVLTEAVGSNVLLQPSISGSPPLSYQWLLNGQPIAGATADRLFLSAITEAHAGKYSVRIANPHGTATSGTSELRPVQNTEPGPIVDATFKPALSMPNGVAALVEQSDGKVVIGGRGFFVTAGVSSFGLARLDRDGSIDPTFAIGSGLSNGGSVSQLLLQPNGKILVGGSFDSINGVPRRSIARLNADGSVDMSFSLSPDLPLSGPKKISSAPSGGFLVLANDVLIRLREDGTVDSSFPQLSASDFGVFENGTIAVSDANRILRRFASNGTSDPVPIRGVPAATSPSIGFSFTGELFSSTSGNVFGLSSYQTGGSIQHGYRVQVSELDGAYTQAFGPFDRDRWDPSPVFTATPSGGIYAASNNGVTGFSAPKKASVIYRYATSRSLDTSFDSRAGGDGAVSALFATRDGGVFVTGSFTKFDQISRPNLVRLVSTNALRATAPALVSVTPEAAAVLPGTTVRLEATASGTSSLTYEWTFSTVSGGVTAPIATGSLSSAAQLLPLSPGVYVALVTVSNRAGRVTSAPIRITVAETAPIIAIPPTATRVFSGQSATLSVTAAGTPPFTYQWFRDGTLVGSSESLVIPRASSLNQGDYTVVVSNSQGKTASSAVRLTVDSAARLVNLSTRSTLDFRPPWRPLIAGFVIAEGTGLRLLVRGVGPTLSSFGLSGLIADPTLSVFDSSQRLVGENDNFLSTTPDGTIPGVGAFKLSSLDSAWSGTLPPGGYTVQLFDRTLRNGIGLIEIYRADSGSSRLINLSSRCFVGTESSVAIAGIALEGERPRQFLIRAVGPGLKQFGVNDALVDPVLNLTSAMGVSLHQNDDWGSVANLVDLTSASASVGAFPLAASSKDAAILVSLAPGNYTALVSGAGGTSGSALIEVYEVP